MAGGGEIYRAAWDRLTGLEITEVDAEPEGDVTFPEIRPDEWREMSREPHAGVRLRRLSTPLVCSRSVCSPADP